MASFGGVLLLLAMMVVVVDFCFVCLFDIGPGDQARVITLAW